MSRQPHKEEEQIEALIANANHYRIEKKWDQAIASYQKALRLKMIDLDPRHPDHAFILNDLGRCFEEKKDWGNALDFHERCLAARSEALHDDMPQIARSRMRIGVCLEMLHRKEAALDQYNQAFAIYEFRFGIEHENSQAALGSFLKLGAELEGCTVEELWKKLKEHTEGKASSEQSPS